MASRELLRVSSEARLAVTGASGFIGRRLVEAALLRGWQVVALVRNPDALGGLSRAELQVMQWQVGEALPREHLAGCRAFCHLAAYVPHNQRDPSVALECHRVNALGLMEVAASAADTGVGHFVQFSTGQLYAARTGLASEDDPVWPSPRAPFYLASKIAAEVYLDHIRTSRSLPATTLRLGSVYGAGMGKQGVVANFLARLQSGEPVVVHAGGQDGVDLVSVDDVIAATFKAIEAGARGTFNIGSGVSASVLQIARWMTAAAGRGDDAIEVLSPQASLDDGGFAALDITRARAAFDYRPVHPRDGLARLIEERRNNWRVPGR